MTNLCDELKELYNSSKRIPTLAHTVCWDEWDNDIYSELVEQLVGEYLEG